MRRQWPLATLVALTALLYSVLALALAAHLRTYAFDLGIYFEALRSYAHLHLPLVALKGPHYDLLGDHFEPIVATLVPTYWIWPSPNVLLVDQAVLVAVSVIPVWMFTERRFGGAPGKARRTTVCLTATYALAWELQALVGYDFHSLAFAVPILAAAIERADANRWRAATLWALSLLLVKEDLALVVAAFGIYALIRGRRAIAAFLCGTGLAAFVLLLDTILPLFNGGRYPHWSYGELGPGPFAAARHAIAHPLFVLRQLVTPRVKISLISASLVPTGFLCLISPISLLALPNVLERLLSERPNLWGTTFQYNAPLAPILGLAAVDGLYRVTSSRGVPSWLTKSGGWLRSAWLRRAVARSSAPRSGRLPQLGTRGADGTLGAVLLLTVALIFTSRFPISELATGHFTLFRPDPAVGVVKEVERVIPRGSLLSASGNLVPPLLTQDNPMVLTPDSVCGDWVLVQAQSPLFPYQSAQQLTAQLSGLVAHGWQRVLDQEGVLLLHRERRGGGPFVCRRPDPLLAPE